MEFINNAVDYKSYPAEYHEQIKSYKKGPTSPQYAVFKIMDAIYTNQNYKVKTTNQLIGAQLVWKYQVKSPVIKETLYITEEKKNVVPKTENSDDLPDVKHAIEYQISIGNLYTLRTTDNVLHYLAENITKPASEDWMRKNSANFVTLQRSREQKLVKICQSLTR